MLVKIKTWDVMVEEFGFEKGYDEEVIACSGGFVDTMENRMSEDRIIDVAMDNEAYNWLDKEGSDWLITHDMIEKIIGEE